MKETIHLRQKRIKNGTISLYLDTYFKGKREYEFLHLYLVGDKQKDKETLKLAAAIKAKRLIDLQNRSYGFTRRLENVYVVDYTINKQKSFTNAKSAVIYTSMLNYLGKFTNLKRLTFNAIDEDFCARFKTFLEKETKLKQNTKALYWTKFKAVIHDAVKEGILNHDVTRNLANIKTQEVQRQYLTMDEVRLLSQTPCKDDEVKRAFLFSCLTGLRFSDCNNLTWSNIEDDIKGKQSRLMFRQQKTKSQEYFVLNTQARMLLGVRAFNNDSKVFRLPHLDATEHILATWVSAAGIAKHVTFHIARHTFAIMLLELDTDIYTVSKLLGHRELKTTQIYAKVLDKKKIEAVEKIPNIIGGV